MRAARMLNGVVLLVIGVLVPLVAWAGAKARICGEDNVLASGPSSQFHLRSKAGVVIVPSDAIFRRADYVIPECGDVYTHRELSVLPVPIAKRMFVGIGSPEQVTDFVGTARHDRAHLTPGEIPDGLQLVGTLRLTAAGQPGSRIAPPRTAGVWKTSATFGSAYFSDDDWLVYRYPRAELFSVLLAHEDGSPNLVSWPRFEVALVQPHPRPGPIILLLGGALVLAGAVQLITAVRADP